MLAEPNGSPALGRATRKIELLSVPKESTTVCVTQHLHRVTHSHLRTEELEVCTELCEATDVAACNRLGARVQDRLCFAGAERVGNVGLVEIVGARTAAAEVRVG